MQPRMSPLLPLAAILLLTILAIRASASSVASRISIRPRHEARDGLKQHHVQASVDTNPDNEQNETIIKETVSSETQHIFQSIYNSKTWTQEGRGSGKGSTREATQIAVSIIRSVAAKYTVSSLVDAPCGAMEWQPFLLQLLEEDTPALQYTGLDIVPTVISDNRARFKEHANWRFQTHDFSKEPPPEEADLLFSRDALQHLSCGLVVASLRNFALSRPRWLLVGSYNSSANVDIPAGGYFLINLREPPYSMAEGVVQVFSEHTELVLPEEAQKFMLLFSGDYLASLDFKAMRSRC